MGAKPSKPPKQSPVPPQKTYEAEKQLGKDILDKITLKTTAIPAPNQKHFQSTKFAKRREMDAETAGTVSWTEIPSLFAQPARSEARKLVQKYFKLISK